MTGVQNTQKQSLIIAFNDEKIIIDYGIDGIPSEYEQVATFTSIEQAQAYILQEYADEHEKNPFSFVEVSEKELFLISCLDDFEEISSTKELCNAIKIMLENRDTKRYNRLLHEFEVATMYSNYDIGKKFQYELLAYWGILKDVVWDDDGYEAQSIPNLQKNINSYRKMIDELQGEFDNIFK